MTRKMIPTSGRRYIAVVNAILAVIVLGACEDDPVGIEIDQDEPVNLREGFNAYVVVSDVDASTGSTITVEARIRSVDTDLTPTSFVVDLLFDPEMLEPIEAVTLQEDILRIVNLTAGSGRIRAVGAAPNGLDTETLLIVRMKVKQPRYAETFALDVREFVVTEDFADIAPQVWTISGAVSQQTEVR